MPTRPHHEIYQENMIMRKHGFPQFSADPEGNSSLGQVNGIAQVQLGDLGYFEEGRFHRLETLDVEQIQGIRNVRISQKYIPFDKPECADSVKKIEVGGNASVSDPAGIVPVGGGVKLKIQCMHGEGAILNLESGGAVYRYFEKPTKSFLGKYMLTHYKNWMEEKGYGEFLDNAHDLFLVTGTYMTKNWEAATFVNNTKSVGTEVSVDAVLVEGNVGIDWRTWTPIDRGFRSGHVHIGVDYPAHTSVHSFGACCHSCEQIPENQCIFLRGWRVREMFQFVDSSLVAPISVENIKRVDWRRTQFIRKQASSKASSAAPIAGSSGPNNNSSWRIGQASEWTIDDTGTAQLEEGEGTPKNASYGDLYDFVALLKYRNESEAIIPIHDDEVIALLSEGHSAEVGIGSTTSTKTILPKLIPSEIPKYMKKPKVEQFSKKFKDIPSPSEPFRSSLKGPSKRAVDLVSESMFIDPPNASHAIRGGGSQWLRLSNSDGNIDAICRRLEMFKHGLLCVRFSNLTDDDLAKIIPMIHDITSLTSVNLDLINFGNKARAALLGAICKNRSIISVSGNIELTEEIEAALQCNIGTLGNRTAFSFKPTCFNPDGILFLGDQGCFTLRFLAPTEGNLILRISHECGNYITTLQIKKVESFQHQVPEQRVTEDIFLLSQIHFTPGHQTTLTFVPNNGQGFYKLYNVQLLDEALNPYNAASGVSHPSTTYGNVPGWTQIAF